MSTFLWWNYSGNGYLNGSCLLPTRDGDVQSQFINTPVMFPAQRTLSSPPAGGTNLFASMPLAPDGQYYSENEYWYWRGVAQYQIFGLMCPDIFYAAADFPISMNGNGTDVLPLPAVA